MEVLMKIFAWLLRIFSFLVLVIALRFLKRDYSTQKKNMEGVEHRKKSAFCFEANINEKELIKDKEWLKRKNKGRDPETYEDTIEYTEYLNNINDLVLNI